MPAAVMTAPRHHQRVPLDASQERARANASGSADGAATPLAHAADTPPAATPNSLAFSDKLPLPLVSSHALSADLLALLYLQAADEHAEVPADRNQRPMLVVHLHAQRAIGAL